VPELSGVEELETVLPVEIRQATWRELKAAGFELPELQVSRSVFWIAVALVLTPLGLLVLAVRTWFAVLSIIEFTFLAYKFTRPLAIHPPDWCKTVGQAALCLKYIRGAHGAVVPWTREEITDRVRMIIGEAAGVPIDKVTHDTLLIDLLRC
jgi:hypothetical protein